MSDWQRSQPGSGEKESLEQDQQRERAGVSEEHAYFLERKERLKRELGHTDSDDSRMLVPSSLELGPGAVDKYVISKQIVRMQEPRRLTPDDLEERRIIYPESPNRALVNKFRDLRTKLLELSGGNNFTMVVSGAGEGAGSSFVALNLAAAFAFDQSKTALIIDCNLREPSLHSVLDIIPDQGLTDFLDDPDYDIARILYPTGIPRLRLIPAGSRRETPSEFFTSFRMKQFIQAVRKRYPDRFIVLDTAPISDSPDARILTELCDYGLLVIPHGKITPAAAEQAATAFNPDKFVGAIING
ncbi:exopolysaccharide/PEP-CTERM locus tyrosine autokinase [Marinobacter gudaonensis]|uniref:Exopolysaccharide/PEP-CTERM locus tyrosine autokinase n=1 Tax=Marinobacter gudaonensis TaxID=375760 RepID=A0A1I6GDW8_9GAMM|nr:polysaccharide biosynthesis protein [Marinobacter gudaonensis]SFR40330.1 exopolysaccharide/PEP-CTERM locus tyrosine autokinase [Marinobacter gudaonensis]